MRKVAVLPILLMCAITITGCATKEEKKEVKKDTMPPVATTQTPVAKQQEKPTDPNFIALRQRLDEYLQKEKFNGSVLVIKDGITILNKGYGFADRENNIENTPITKFRIGSITKTVVATAILQLQEQGKLDVNQNVNRYLPSFPVSRNITLYHLLTHTSGLMTLGKGSHKITPTNHEQLTTWIGNQTLAFPAGTGWYYTDQNYMVLGYIVEKVSGQPLKEYIQQHIFDRVGMVNSGMGSLEGVENVSKGYKYASNDDIILADKPSVAWAFGCGDMYTTTEDMQKLDEGIVTGQLLKPESIQQMFTSSAHSSYGFSFYVKEKFSHNHGVLSGWSTYNNISADRKSYIITFSNVQSSIGDLFNNAFRDMVMNP